MTAAPASAAGNVPATAPLDLWGVDGTANAVVVSGSTVYVADTGNDRIVVLTTAGGAVGTFGSAGSSGAHLDGPRGVDVSGTKIAVADYGNNRIALWQR